MSSNNISIFVMAALLGTSWGIICILVNTIKELKIKNKDNSVVRLCLDKQCRNNRVGIGELECNCREIEIIDGKCQQYIKREEKK